MSYVTSQDRVLRIAISTAENGSSLQGAALAEGAEALGTLDDSVGAVLLVGEGPNFCTGGDVGAFGSATDPGAFVLELANAFHAFQRAVAAAPVPVVAAVHGWAAGAGLSIALTADIAVAGTSTRLRPAYPGIGFSPDGGMSWTLPRIVGMAAPGTSC